MKNLILVITLVAIALNIKAQEPRYQAYSSSLTILAVKDGQKIEWHNKNINMALNYKTGDFIANIKGSDFSDPRSGQPELDDAEASPDRLFKLSGIFPIDALTDQQTTNANYEVELQLTNQDDSLFETILFKMNVTKPGDGDLSYRIFVLNGTLYAYDLQLPVFEGMDNEISLQLFFNAYWED